MTDTFQFERCDAVGGGCVDIAGATNSTYDLQPGDATHTIRVRGTRDAFTGISDHTGVVRASGPPPDPSTYVPNKFFNGGAGTSIDSFLASLNPGDVAGLSGICLVNTFVWRTSGATLLAKTGTEANPIVLTSADWLTPATLKFAGATNWDIRGQIGWWIFDFLFIDDTQTGKPTTLACGGHDIMFRRLDVTNHQHHIGMNLIAGTGYGDSRNCTISRCRIHEIGPVAYDNRSHGIYNYGIDNLCEDNIIYLCSARGIQDRSATRGRYNYNISVDNRVGIIVGDPNSSGLRGTKNIFAFNQYAAVRTYNNAAGSDNILDDNFEYQLGPDASLEHLTNTNVHNADPLFVNRAAHDYTLQGGSPALGYGPRVSVGPT